MLFAYSSGRMACRRCLSKISCESRIQIEFRFKLCAQSTQSSCLDPHRRMMFDLWQIQHRLHGINVSDTGDRDGRLLLTYELRPVAE